VRKIVVHPGKAHRDDYFSVGLAIASGLAPRGVEVERRDPTGEELGDPDVLVLDVGLSHDPDRSNFDHHQHDCPEGECALTLLAKHTGHHELFRLEQWYGLTAMMDSQGPFATAEHLRLPQFPFALLSPIEDAMLAEFENNPTREAFVAADIIERLIGMAEARKEAYQMLEENSKVGTLDVRGVSLAYLLVANYDKNPVYVTQWVTHKEYEFVFSVTPDDRGNGWTLYRFNDHPALDFNKIDNNEEVLFAHKGGFLAKTKFKLDLEEVLGLVKASTTLK